LEKLLGDNSEIHVDIQR
jgi:hypothetical protein